MSGRLEKWGDLPMDRREAEVRLMIGAGASAQQMANRLSERHGVDVSRSAVVGFCKRRGIALAHRRGGQVAIEPETGGGREFVLSPWAQIDLEARLEFVRGAAAKGASVVGTARMAEVHFNVPVKRQNIHDFCRTHEIRLADGRKRVKPEPGSVAARPVRAKVMRCGLPAAPDVMTPGALSPRGIVVVRGPRHAADTVAAVMGAGPGTCRAPHGEPGEAGFRFCGAPVTGKGAWCADHRARYFTRGVSPDAD